MKSATYIIEVSVWGEKSTCLLASCQLRHFPREFTENCFDVSDQSSLAIYLMWYWSLLFFRDFSFVMSFMVWLQHFSQIKGAEGGSTFLCVAWSVNVQQKFFFFFHLKAKYSIIHFVDQGGTIVNLI